MTLWVAHTAFSAVFESVFLLSPAKLSVPYGQTEGCCCPQESQQKSRSKPWPEGRDLQQAAGLELAPALQLSFSDSYPFVLLISGLYCKSSLLPWVFLEEEVWKTWGKQRRATLPLLQVNFIIFYKLHKEVQKQKQGEGKKCLCHQSVHLCKVCLKVSLGSWSNNPANCCSQFLVAWNSFRLLWFIPDPQTCPSAPASTQDKSRTPAHTWFNSSKCSHSWQTIRITMETMTVCLAEPCNVQYPKLF